MLMVLTSVPSLTSSLCLLVLERTLRPQRKSGLLPPLYGLSAVITAAISGAIFFLNPPMFFSEISGRFGEGEGHALKIDRGVPRDSAGADSLIKGVPQVVEGVGRDRKEIAGDGLPELNLSNIKSRMRVELYSCDMWILIEESLASSTKLVAMFPSPTE